jgi:antitoxin component of MazEF toxin-antitoxin module
MSQEQVLQPKKVIKTGNSLAVVVPAKFVKKAGIQAGDPVDVTD